MKKIVSIIIIVIMLLVSVFSTSAYLVDETLFLAQNITRRVFLTGEHKESIGHISASYIKSFDGEQDYILAECDSGGYAIFLRDTMELLEYSDYDLSPYSNVGGENRYYGGLVNYYEKEGNYFNNISTDEKIDKLTAISIANNIKEMIKEKTNIFLEKDVIDSNLEMTVVGSNEELSNIIDDEHDANEYEIYSRSYIEDKDYFIFNNRHGLNTSTQNTNTCISVATQLLLSYHNWKNDGRIIPQNSPENDFQFYLVDQTTEVKAQPYSINRMATTSDNTEANGKQSFFDVLVSIINPIIVDPETNGRVEAGLSILPLCIQNYLIQHEISSSLFEYSYSTNLVNTVAIDNELINNRPVILGLLYGKTNNTGMTNDIVSHAVVAYGKQTIIQNGKTIDGYIAHFGWRESTHIWLNKNWVMGYFSFNCSHEHNDIVFNNDNHLRICTICDRTTSVQDHTYTGATKRYIFSKNSNSSDKIEKDYEVDPQYHYDVCSCGATKKALHLRFRYVNNGIRHIKTCECGYEKEEDHLYKTSEDVCYWCSGGGWL